MSVFTAYLHCNLGEVSSFTRKNFVYCGISTVAILVNNSGGVFLLRVSGGARLFPAVQTICLGISLKLVEIYKFYGLSGFLCKKKDNWFMVCK